MIVLAGGKVTSAGIIVVKNGIVKSLSPLSGHYRSSIDVSTLLSFNIPFQYHLPISSSDIIFQYTPSILLINVLSPYNLSP
jgi:hypothetical protein